MSVTFKATDRVFNFSAGPAVLPEPVLEEIRENMMALPGVGSSEFIAIYEDAVARLRRLMNVPESHEILFLQGGARLQNAMIPMNLLMTPDQTADYAITGSWGKKSADEVPRFGNLNVAYDGSAEGYIRTPDVSELQLSDNAAYFHYTSNETIHGVQYKDVPVASAPLVVDQSSDFMSREMDVSKFGLVYACAQKNIGIAGVTVVLIERSLLERAQGRLPGYLEYANHAAAQSMYNTPPTFGVYVVGLVGKWLEETIGGIAQMEQINRRKAALLYSVLDAYPNLYIGHAKSECRSDMNVVFRLPDDGTSERFLAGAAGHRLTSLKGHRSVGGIRASIYNAMPSEGVKALADYMKDFAEAGA